MKYLDFDTEGICMHNARGTQYEWRLRSAYTLTVVLILGVFVAGELYNMVKDSFVDNLQHVAMYVAFGMVNLCPILWHHKVPLPRGTDYALFLLALMIELTTLAHHLGGRQTPDVQVHQSKHHPKTDDPTDHLLLDSDSVPMILGHSYLVGKLTSSKIADTK